MALIPLSFLEWKFWKNSILGQGCVRIFEREWEAFGFLYIYVHFVKNVAKALGNFG